jgi:flagellar biosynthesis protein FlhF
MRVKRFTADDMTKAMRQVRQELGADAVILSTDRLPGGGVEISAAMDERKKDCVAFNDRQTASDETPSASSTAMAALARRMEGLGEMVTRHLVVAEAAAGFAARSEVAPLYHYMMRQEIDPGLINQLLDGLSAPEGVGLLPRFSIRLKKLLNIADPLRVKSGGPVVWALVGPTGVGKTTTIAKLAARYALKHGLTVGMITVDTFRMAAPEQLKVYGRIMDIPTKVASSPAELREAVEELSDRELILVDTVGRSPSDEENLVELASVLAGVKGLENHLVMSAPTRDRDLQEVSKAFNRFQPQSIIFTKLDETDTFGPILNQMVRDEKPVSFLTFGQKVPDDLEEADREGLAKRLTPSRRDLESF